MKETCDCSLSGKAGKVHFLFCLQATSERNMTNAPHDEKHKGLLQKCLHKNLFFHYFFGKVCTFDNILRLLAALTIPNFFDSVVARALCLHCSFMERLL